MARGRPIITHFTGGEVSDKTDGRVDQEGYYACLSKLLNMIPLVQGPATKRTGSRFVREVKTSSKYTWLIPFEYSAGDNYTLEFGEGYIRFYAMQGIVMNGGNPLEVVSPYQEEDLWNIRYAQVGDIIFLAHPFYPLKQLTRVTSTNWTLTDVAFVWGPFRDEDDRGYTITPSGTTGAINLTCSGSVFTANHVGSQIKVTGDAVTSNTFTGLANGTAVAVTQGESIIISLSGTWVATMLLERSYDNGATWVPYISYTTNATYEFVALEAGTQYRWRCSVFTSGTVTARISVRNRSGYATITSYSSGTLVAATVVQPMPGTTAFTRWNESAFSAVYGYATAVRFFEQRLLLAGSLDEPNRVYASRVDDYPNFQTGVGDDYAYSYALAGNRVNPILWACDTRVLFFGTSGDEWKFGKADEPTTPNAVDAKKETEHGSEAIQALLIENSVIFVEANGQALRAISYDFDTDAYQAPRFSDHAEHLLQAGVITICFQAQPTPILWCVMADGDLVGVTYSRAKKIAAFHRHQLGGGGIVEAASVVRGDGRDELWLVVRRTINGQVKRYVEFMETDAFTDLTDAFFVDSGLTYSGAAVTGLSGLGHLEGKTVKVVANGAVHADRVVTAGAIALEYPATQVTVGLGYTGVLRTKRLELKGGSGTSQGQLKQIYDMTIRLYRTVTCNVGFDEGETWPIFFRKTTTPLGEPPELFSGDKRVQMKERGTNDAYVCVTSDAPAPLTVSAIVPTIYASEL